MNSDVVFLVAEECVRLGLRAGAVVFRGVRVGAAPPELRSLIQEEVAAVRRRHAGPAEVRSSPDVVRFQELLRKVGANPRRDPPSLERLLLFALKRGGLPAINALVDAYNLVSIRYGLSLGAHDLDRVAAPVSLRLFTGGELFTPLGRAEPEPVTPGEYGYVDAGGRVLCRLDVLQADFSKVTEATANAVLIIEGTEGHAPEVFRDARAEVVALVTRFCGGTAELVTP